VAVPCFASFWHPPDCCARITYAADMIGGSSHIYTYYLIIRSTLSDLSHYPFVGLVPLNPTGASVSGRGVHTTKRTVHGILLRQKRGFHRVG
jgi:hypothetical protein